MIMEGILTPFDYLGPFWGLTLLSILSGAGLLWVVGKTTPQKRVEKSRNQMDSAIYEIRLFIDSPKRVGISLVRLMTNSVLYVAYMMPAFVILALPMALMILGLETRHGMEPVSVDKAIVVTVELADGVDGNKLTVSGEHIEVTAPPLYVQSENRVYVRLVANSEGSLVANFAIDRNVEKLIVTDPNALQMAPDRTSGLDLLMSFGPESNLDDGQIKSILVPHVAKDTSYLGIGMPWWLWWMILMMIAAFALKKPMGVTL
ncbi:MAG: hypothetical protein JKY56_15305 [Kofleriaceae bacterium]|nr:hypothetical protein [Kofleriaceae bacterium]